MPYFIPGREDVIKKKKGTAASCLVAKEEISQIFRQPKSVWVRSIFCQWRQ